MNQSENQWMNKNKKMNKIAWIRKWINKGIDDWIDSLNWFVPIEKGVFQTRHSPWLAIAIPFDTLEKLLLTVDNFLPTE